MPSRNVAVATGAPGQDVLDIDVRPDGSGYAAYNRLRRAGLVNGSLALVATPSGGLHAYYRGSAQRGGRLPAHHLDCKAAGGYVLAPPSQVNGKRYHVVQRRPAMATLDWAAVTRMLKPAERRAYDARPDRHHDLCRLVAWVAGLPEGNRNAGLFWAACRLAESGRADLLAELGDAARSTGLPGTEISRSLASARRAAEREHSTDGAAPERMAGLDAEAAS